MNAAQPSDEALPHPRWRCATFFGIGSIVVAFTWCGCGWWLFGAVGTRTLMLTLNQAMTIGLEQQAQQRPVPPPVRQSADPLGALMWQATPNAPAGPVRTPAPVPVRPASPPKSGFEPARAELARQAWAGLTACLVGLLITCGLSMFVGRPDQGRRLRRFVAGAAALETIAFSVWRFTRHRHGQDALVHIVAITQSRFVWAGFILLALLTMTLSGAIALRPSRRQATWIRIAIAVGFVGTFATLGAIAVLIQYAGFPPLPTWMYALVALVQSAWSWIVLMLPRPQHEDAAYSHSLGSSAVASE